MGFSPGEFEIERPNGEIVKVHWELRHGRVVLWRYDELEIIMEIPQTQVGKAASQLNCLWEMT